MKNIIDETLNNCTSHKEWLDVMQFGLSSSVEKPPSWLILHIVAQAKKQLELGAKSSESMLIDQLFGQLGIKIVIKEEG